MILPPKSPGPVALEIRERLTRSLAPTRLEISDDSDRHHGHAGHDPRGESHFTIRIESRAFAGHSRIARQRMVNAALADLLKTRIHALALQAHLPEEGGEGGA